MGATSDDGDGRNQPQRCVTAGALFTLVQSALLLSASAIGLSLYNCSLSSSTSNENWRKVRLYYFSNIHCPITYTVDGNKYSLEQVNPAALRTMIIMCIYMAFSVFWVIGSFLLLVSSIKGKHMRPDVGRFFHSPWVISMVLILIFDVIAAILYLVDLTSTSEYSSLEKFLNIKPEYGRPDIEGRSMPPIIMALLTSKGVLLWIINIVVLVLLLKQFKKLFELRQDAQMLQAQLANISNYSLPSSLMRSKSTSKDVPHFGPPTTLPRLISKDGGVVGVQNAHSPTPSRPSALQLAARQGFSYERPPSTPLSSTSVPSYSPHTPQANSPQRFYDAYSLDKSDIWNTQSRSHPPSSHNGSNNILNKGNDMFY